MACPWYGVGTTMLITIMSFTKMRWPLENIFRLAAQTKTYAIFDNFLPEKDFFSLCDSIEMEHTVQDRRSPFTGRVELKNDCVMTRTSVKASSNAGIMEYDPMGHRYYPTGRELDRFIGKLMESAASFEEFIGRKNQCWDRLLINTFVYPAGAGFVWHRDDRTYTGTCIFFAHTHWNVAWGGEVFLFDEDFEPKENTPFQCFPGRPDKEDMLNKGICLCVMPKPNRLILMKQGVYHRVNRVDADAGESTRVSLTGSFIKKTALETEEGFIDLHSALSRKHAFVLKEGVVPEMIEPAGMGEGETGFRLSIARSLGRQTMEVSAFCYAVSRVFEARRPLKDAVDEIMTSFDIISDENRKMVEEKILRQIQELLDGGVLSIT